MFYLLSVSGCVRFICEVDATILLSGGKNSKCNGEPVKDFKQVKKMV